MSYRAEKQAEEDRNHRLVLQNDFISQLRDTLNDYWLLDSSEYTVIKNLIKEEIERIKKRSDPSTLQFMTVMVDKVEYIISNGLCKRFPQT